MTKRERITAALSFQGPDRVPLVDWIQHSGVIAYYAGARERKNEWTYEEAAAAARNALDMVQEVTPSYTPRVPLDGAHGYLLDDGEWVEMTEDGIEIRRNYWQEAVLRRPFSDIKSLSRFLEIRLEKLEGEIGSPDWPQRAATYRAKFHKDQQLLGDTTIMFMVSPLNFDGLVQLVGWDLFPDLYFERPRLLSAWLDAHMRLALRWIEHIGSKELSPVALVWSDVASKTGLLVSPHFLRKELIPRVERLARAWHARGVGVIYHSEGNIRDILDDLVAAGVDGINPLEPDSHMAAKEIRQRYPRLVLWGGIDNARLLVRGTVEEVSAQVKDIIDTCGIEGGLLLGSSGQVHPGCRTENVIAMYETARDYRPGSR